MTLSDNARGVILMNIAMLAFTVNDTFMKAATKTLPLFQAIWMRGIISVVVLLAIGLVVTKGASQLWPKGRDMRIVLVRTAADVGATILFLAALVHMPLANLSAIMQSLPLAVTLTAALVFGDAIGWRRMLAIAVGFVGVLLIIRPGTADFDFWSLMGLGSVACVVVRDLATRELSAKVPSVAVAIWGAVAVALMGFAGSAVEGVVPVNTTQVLLILGAASSLIVGYLTVVMVMRVGDIGLIAPFRYTALLWAILLGWLLFDDLPDYWTTVGSAIVVATGIYTLWRERVRRLAALRG